MKKIYQSIIIVSLCILIVSDDLTPINELQQIGQDLQTMTNDSIYMIGYAIAAQGAFVNYHAYVYRIFYCKNIQDVYGLYMHSQIKNVKEYYKFMFRVHQNDQEIQILLFQKSMNPLQPKTNDNSTKSIANKSQSTNSPRSDKSSQQSTSPKSLKIKQTSLIANSQILSYQSQKIDITKTYQKDLYFPKINILLQSNFKNNLKNNKVQKVYYTITIKNNLIKLIRYTIIYFNLNNNQSYQFIVNIENNNLEIIKGPVKYSSGKNLFGQNNNSKFILNDTHQLSAIEQNVNEGIIDDVKNHTFASLQEQKITKQSKQTVQNHNSSKQSQVNNITQQENNVTLQNQNSSVQIKDSKVEIQDKSVQSQNKNVQSHKKSLQSQNISIQNQNNSVQSQNRSIQNQTSKPVNTNGNEKISYASIAKDLLTTNAKYRSLINGVKQMSKIPLNSTALSLQYWIYQSMVKIIYKIMFQMNYQQSYNNSTGRRYAVFVEEGNKNIINMLNQSYQQLNQSKPSNNKQTIIKEEIKEKKIDGQINKIQSQYFILSQLAEKLRFTILKYTPQLKNFNMDFKYQLCKDVQKGNRIVKYKALVIFRKNKIGVCYKVHFSVLDTQLFPKITKLKNGNNILINNYQLTKCQQSEPSSIFENNQTVNFKLSKIDNKIQLFLESIHEKCPIFIERCQKYQLLYRIKYSACNKFVYQIQLHQTNMAVVSYKRIAQNLYQRVQNKGRDERLQYFYFKLSVYFNTSMQNIELLNVDLLIQVNQTEIVKINGRLTNNIIFAPQISSYFAILAIITKQDHYEMIQIINQPSVILQQNKYFSINFRNRQQWKEVSFRLRYSDYRTMMGLLKKNYSYFMQDSVILALYEPSQKNTNRLRASKDITQFKIVMKKTFTKKYIVYYAFLLNYNQIKGENVIVEIQSLKRNQIQQNNCKQRQAKDHFEICQQCVQGYRLVQGICHPIIQNCKDYWKQLCINCQFDYYQQQITKKCPKANNSFKKMTQLTQINFFNKQ